MEYYDSLSSEQRLCLRKRISTSSFDLSFKTANLSLTLCDRNEESAHVSTSFPNGHSKNKPLSKANFL